MTRKRGRPTKSGATMGEMISLRMTSQLKKQLDHVSGDRDPQDVLRGLISEKFKTQVKRETGGFDDDD